MQEDEPPPQDVFEILLSTDNHLGYGEKKTITGDDSFRTFEEILQIAEKNNVDMILLGGDLFHDAQPSSHSVYKCIELLKKYCLGDKPVQIEFLSDQCENFKHMSNPVVNYEDPNLNVSIPVFSIHGNHDNPTGTQQISALDVLAANGLVNYFGRWSDIRDIEIKPILLKKGETKIAVYGLSHIPDQRLARLFQEKKVSMPRPEGDGWFNILVLHQNRANRGVKNFIPYNVIPDFINLVMWGHEHDCEITPAMQDNGVYITQPGSSVATSLSEGEALPKHVGILKIYKTEFKIVEMPLITVRPFIFSDVLLTHPQSEEYDLDNPKAQALVAVKEKVAQMLKLAERKQRDPGAPHLIPFIRLFVKYYSDSQVFNAIRLGHEYEDNVANPADMFKLVNWNIRQRTQRNTAVPVPIEDDEFENVDEWANRVEDVVEKYFSNYERAKDIGVLSIKLLTTAVAKFIDTDDAEAVKYAMELQAKDTLDRMIAKNPDMENVSQCLEEIKQERQRDEEKELASLVKKLNDKNRPLLKSVDDEVTILDDDDEVSPTRPARGKGSRGGRVSRAANTSTGGRGRRGRGRANAS